MEEISKHSQECGHGLYIPKQLQERALSLHASKTAEHDLESMMFTLHPPALVGLLRSVSQDDYSNTAAGKTMFGVQSVLEAAGVTHAHV